MVGGAGGGHRHWECCGRAIALGGVFSSALVACESSLVPASSAKMPVARSGTEDSNSKFKWKYLTRSALASNLAAGRKKMLIFTSPIPSLTS